jgi:hypothetical protein
MPGVERSIAYLRQHALSEPSGLSLGMALLCFRVFDLDASEIAATLLACWDRTRFLGNLQVTALARYALTADDHGATAVRL